MATSGNEYFTDILDHLNEIHELLHKDPDIVQKESPLIVLDNKSDMRMSKNGKDTKHTRHISRGIHLVSNE